MRALAAGRNRGNGGSFRRTRSRQRDRLRERRPAPPPRQPQSAAVPASRLDATLICLKRTLLSLLGVSALLLVAVFSVRPATVQRARDSSFRSAALRGALHFEAYLPTDYST